MSSTRRLVLLPAYILVFALAPACAPRVSKRAASRPYSEPAPSALLAPKTVVSVAPIAPAKPAVPAAEKAEPAPTLVVRTVEAPPPKATVEEVDGAEEDTGYAPERTTGKARTNFYAFSDTEISSLRKRSREFRKLHDKLRTCTAKSERSIAKRENVREEIIRLQNEEHRTPKQDKRLSELRSEERKLKANRGESDECQKLEVRLTDMLRATFDASARI